MAEKIYTWGFVGAGKMAQNMARDLQFSERSKITAVASKTSRSADAFAKQFSAGNVYGDVSELVRDPDIDIIYISTPNNLHHPHAKAAIQAGKAVLLEKPFTLNAAQTKELVQLANQNGVFLMEAMWIRYLPVIEKLKELLAQKVIGNIQFLKTGFHVHLDFPPEHRTYNLALGGGALLDLGIYPISFASLIYKTQPGELVSVAKIGETGVDEHFGAVFHYPGGEMAMVSAAADGDHYQDIMIYGDRGHIKIDAHRSWKYSRMTIHPLGQPEQVHEYPYLGTGYSYQAEEVIDCLEKGDLESPAMPLKETVEIMETLDQLRSQWGLKYPGE